MPRNEQTTMNNGNGMQKNMGILAAWGQLPFAVVEAMKEQGAHISCAGVIGHADPKLAEICDNFTWIGIGKLGRAIRFFRKHDVHQATMAGKFHKAIILRPGMIIRHLPDWTTVKTFFPHFISGKKDFKDDTLLGTLADAFGKGGIEFLPATDLAPGLLVPAGQLAGKPPTPALSRDIQFGWDLAKAMGGLDIGQSVCIRNQAALAIEAIEGTDACILRAGELCERNEFTIVKVAKPQQDMRFDVPTIGIGTLKSMVAAGATVLAVEAHKTIQLDGDAFRDFATRHKLSVISLESAANVAAA